MWSATILCTLVAQACAAELAANPDSEVLNFMENMTDLSVDQRQEDSIKRDSMDKLVDILVDKMLDKLDEMMKYKWDGTRKEDEFDRMYNATRKQAAWGGFKTLPLFNNIIGQVILAGGVYFVFNIRKFFPGKYDTVWPYVPPDHLESVQTEGYVRYVSEYEEPPDEELIDNPKRENLKKRRLKKREKVKKKFEKNQEIQSWGNYLTDGTGWEYLPGNEEFQQYAKKESKYKRYWWWRGLSNAISGTGGAGLNPDEESPYPDPYSDPAFMQQVQENSEG